VDFADQFQSLFQNIFWKTVRKMPDETARPSVQTTAILRVISQVGPSTVGELAKHLDRGQSTISETIERLMGRGLVDRMPDATDGRRSLIWLSPEGRDVLLKASTPLDIHLIDGLSERLTNADRDDLIRILKKMTGVEDA
jgi:DNA-binding MarR family transcriptional regulator